MSTGLQVPYLQLISRRTKRKHQSDVVEAVKGTGRAHRLPCTIPRDVQPSKRRKTKKTRSAPPREFFVLSEQPDRDCDVRNHSPKPERNVFRSSPTLCPSDTYLSRFSNPKNECSKSPVHSSPSPVSPKTRLLQRQQVDWTYVSDTEDAIVSEAVGPDEEDIPALRESEDRVVANDGDDTGYDGASEWEVLSDASLQGRFNMKDVILIHSDDGRTIFTRQRASTCTANGSRCVGAEGCCCLASSPRIQHTLRSYTPSPMNSDDYRRIIDAPDDREPSPLSPRPKNVGSGERQHSEPPHVIVCYPFCDSPKPLSEGFGSPSRVTPNREVKEASEPWPGDAPQNRDVSHDVFERNDDGEHQGVYRGEVVSTISALRTHVAYSAYTPASQITHSERGRLWPVFDWSRPYPIDQDSLSGND